MGPGSELSGGVERGQPGSGVPGTDRPRPDRHGEPGPQPGPVIGLLVRRRVLPAPGVGPDRDAPRDRVDVRLGGQVVLVHDRAHLRRPGQQLLREPPAVPGSRDRRERALRLSERQVLGGDPGRSGVGLLRLGPHLRDRDHEPVGDRSPLVPVHPHGAGSTVHEAERRVPLRRTAEVPVHAPRRDGCDDPRPPAGPVVHGAVLPVRHRVEPHPERSVPVGLPGDEIRPSTGHRARRCTAGPTSCGCSTRSRRSGTPAA